MLEEDAGMIWCFICGFVIGEFVGLMIAALVNAAHRGDSHGDE